MGEILHEATGLMRPARSPNSITGTSHWRRPATPIKRSRTCLAPGKILVDVDLLVLSPASETAQHE